MSTAANLEDKVVGLGYGCLPVILWRSEEGRRVGVDRLEVLASDDVRATIVAEALAQAGLVVRHMREEALDDNNRGDRVQEDDTGELPDL